MIWARFLRWPAATFVLASSCMARFCLACLANAYPPRPGEIHFPASVLLRSCQNF
jgi:hypothetical protein